MSAQSGSLPPASGSVVPSADSAGGPGRRTRRPRSAHSLQAHGEPMLWLTGGGLVICAVMIVGLLLLILFQGATTFWPLPVIQVRTLDDNVHMGEVTRQDTYELTYGSLVSLEEAARKRAVELLNPRLHDKLASVLARDTEQTLARLHEPAVRTAVYAVGLLDQVREAPGTERSQLLERASTMLESHRDAFLKRLRGELATAVESDPSGESLYRIWTAARQAEEGWHELPFAELTEALQDEQLAFQVWASHMMARLVGDVAIDMRRRLIRTGNFDLTNEHFNWVSDFEVVEGTERYPEWVIVFERLAWGRFFGFPKSLKIDGTAVATAPAEIWEQFRKRHPEVRRRWQQRRELEKLDTGHVNLKLEKARLELRDVELRFGKDSPQWRAAQRTFEEKKSALDKQFADIRQRIVELDSENARYQLLVETAQGEEKELALADIVRAYPANQLALSDKSQIYVSRWVEFLTDDPREANSEGGVFPAIFGTVVMTVLMSAAVVPFGVLAALYLREYAKAGPMVSTVRIAVNNLAGVPSIVFGVFGLGFFCYILGGGIDELFYESKLPSPTYGTGGVLWASLTLALLTLPVVIVATEEALAAVPRSMREGSLACGATQWQTIVRIVLPRAMPGIMTGLILAMARGAGEVAPLMMVGAVKLAPELTVDLTDWSGSFGPIPTGPLHPQRSFMHLGFHIYDLGFQSQNSEAAKPMVFTTTLLLIAIIALMNVMAIWLRGRLRRRFQYSQF